MIVVDSSVWIDHLRDRDTAEVACLRGLISDGLPPLLVGDLVLCEVLQGLASDRQAALVEAALRRFDVVDMVGPGIATHAATHYRRLRGRGITVRRTIDMLIAAYCIENHHSLLHNDRDFDPLARHCGLRIFPA